MISRWGIPAITSVSLAVVVIVWVSADVATPGVTPGVDNLVWIGLTVFVLVAPVINAVPGPHRLRDTHGWTVVGVALAASAALFWGGRLFSTGLDAADAFLPQPPGANFWLAWEALGLVLVLAAYALAVTFVVLRTTRYRPTPATPVSVGSNPA